MAWWWDSGYVERDLLALKRDVAKIKTDVANVLDLVRSLREDVPSRRTAVFTPGTPKDKET